MWYYGLIPRSSTKYNSTQHVHLPHTFCCRYAQIASVVYNGIWANRAASGLTEGLEGDGCSEYEYCCAYYQDCVEPTTYSCQTEQCPTGTVRLSTLLYLSFKTTRVSHALAHAV